TSSTLTPTKIFENFRKICEKVKFPFAEKTSLVVGRGKNFAPSPWGGAAPSCQLYARMASKASSIAGRCSASALRRFEAADETPELVVNSGNRLSRFLALAVNASLENLANRTYNTKHGSKYLL